MLLDFLSRCLREVEDAVRQAEGAYVERYEEEIVAAGRVTLGNVKKQDLITSYTQRILKKMRAEFCFLYSRSDPKYSHINYTL